MSRTPRQLGKIKFNTQESRTSPRPHEERKLGRSAQITDKDGKIIKINFEELETIKLLGRGQYGIVSKVLHKPTRMVLAVKRINTTSDGEEQRSELQDLDVPLKAGESPYTVKFYGALFAEGFIWVLTECMDTSLDKFYLKAKSLNMKLSEVFLSKIAFSVLSALDYLKKRSIMHRDVKPSNILMNRDGGIKLCDFGISGTMNNSRCQTKERGCRPYMAPEKIDPSTTGGYSVKADVWSLGISLIEIITFKHPYEDAGDYFAQIKAILYGDPPRLSNTDFSPEFCSFVASSLMKKAEERGSLEDLLKHDFITKYSQDTLDLQFIGEMVDKIQADKDEC